MRVRINFDKPLTSSFLPVWRSGARHRPGGGDLGQGEVWSVLVFHGEGIQSISSMEHLGISWRMNSKYFKYSIKYWASSWIKGRTIIYMWLKYQGGGQRLRHPPPLCLSQDRPTRLPHQRHQVELHQVSHQQGGQASGKVGGREVQYLYFRNSNQLLRFGPNDSVVPTVEAEIQKLL